jgi:heme exporter protein D
MYAASLFFSQGEFIFLVWSIALMSLYLFLLVLLKEITLKDFNYFKSLVSKQKKTEIQEELSGNEPSA